MNKENLLHARLVGFSRVYDKVKWNKDFTGFIGYTFFDYMYCVCKDYVYIRDNGICVFQSCTDF